MGFMDSYKRLDQLCRDMNGVGITGYIEDLERRPNGIFFVEGWEADLTHLKHYRYVRNQIAHEIGVNEETVCSAEDEIWIEGFYHVDSGRSGLSERQMEIKKNLMHSGENQSIGRAFRIVLKILLAIVAGILVLVFLLFGMGFSFPF